MKKNKTLLVMAILTSISCSASKYFWVGGSGNWSDFSNHWATTSGGNIFHNQIPQSTDNVFFDVNSFSTSGQTVTIDQTIVQCADMTWTGLPTTTPTLAGDSSQTLRIHGSLVLLTGMAFNFNGQLIMEATTTGKNLSSGGTTINTSLTFNGAGGAWTLMDALKVTRVIYLNNGSLNTNNQTVNASALYSMSSSTRSIIMGASIFNLNGDINGIWNVNPLGMTLNAGTSTINGTSTIGSDGSFYGGGLSYNNLSFANAAFLYGNNTFHDVAFVSTGYINGNNHFHDVSFFVHAFINGNNTFNNVTMGGNGTISSSNTFNNLSFSPWFTYTLQSGQTQTVGNICAQGTGALPIRIQANLAGTPAIISKASGTICWDYVRVSDITATGGAVFNAGLAPTNSQDLGGNTGLLFTGGCTAVSCLSTCTPPSITLNPVPSTVCGGSTASFTIAATGTDLSYQWQVNPGAGFTNLTNNSLYSGVTTNTLNITGATTVLNGNQYRCAAVGVCPLVGMSEAATLSVKPSPIVTVNSAAICPGQTAVLTASIGSNMMDNFPTGTETYAWSTGATTSSISVSPAISTNYTVIVTRNACSTKVIATVTVNPPPSVTVNSATICSGQTAVLMASVGTVFIPVPPAPTPTTTTFTLTGTTTGIITPPPPSPTTYAWSNGATTSSISVSPSATTSYTVTVTTNGCSNTAIATVTVNPLPIVTTTASSTIVTVSATGGTPPYTGTGIFTGLAPGTYSYTVTDANGCIGSTMATVAEPASNCASAIPFTASNSCMNNNTLNGTEKWFSFIAGSTSQRIELKKNPVYLGHVHTMGFYSGTCSSLNLVDSVNITPINDTLLVLNENNLTAGNTYYIKVSREVTLCSLCTNNAAEFDVCLPPAVQIYCPITCNIICNGSFENYGSTCPPTNSTFFGMDVQNTIPWLNPTAATPDLFNSCNLTSHVPDNGAGNQYALPVGSGQGYAGIKVYTNGISSIPQYREYIMAPLNETLIAQQCYYFEMFVSLADQSTVTINSIGAFFSPTLVSSTTQSVLPYSPQIINNTGQLTNYLNWHKISGTFTATGIEKYVIIGNFKGNAYSNVQNNLAHPSYDGTYDAYYYIDQVSLQKMEVDAGNAAPVVCGQGVQLNATTQNCIGTVLNYQWTPATGLNSSTILNPIATPTINTTYSITVSDPNGTCSVTDNVTVMVQSMPPSVPVINGSTSACSEITSYSVTSVSGIDYTWNTSYGASGIGNTASVNFYPANGGTITFVARDIITNCTSSSTLTITPCCKNGNGKNFYNADVSQIISAYGSTTVTGNSFSINGTFTVTQNLQFVNCDIKLGPNAKIDILPPYTLTVRSSHLYACTEMWDGIYINGATATLIVNSKSLLEDAKNAMFSIGGGKYVIDNSVFNKNYKSLVVKNYAGPMTTSSVTKSIFTCRNFSSINYLLISTSNYLSFPTAILITPYLNYRSFTGIEASYMTNVTPIVFGDPTSAGLKNIFDYMDFGIRVLYSNANIYNNFFINFSSTSLLHNVLTGVAIYAEQNKMTNFKVVIGGTGAFDFNEFKYCHFGIYATHYNTFVNSNKFNFISRTAIYTEYGSFRTNEILHNKLVKVLSGIYCYEMGNAFSTKIIANQINVLVPFLGGPAIANYGVTVQNSLAADAKAVIQSNTVKQAKTAIWLIGANKSIVQFNNIQFQNSNAQIQNDYNTYNTLLFGIRVQNSKQSRIIQNTIQKSSAQDPVFSMRDMLRGISIENTAEAYVFNNTMIKMGSGIRSLNTCSNSTLACNTLNKCYFGLNFNNAIIGNQVVYNGVQGIAQGNAWINNVGPTKMYGNIVVPIDFWYKNMPVYLPFPTGLPFSSFNPAQPAIATSSANFCSAAFAATGSGSGRNQKFGKIVRNQVQYSTTSTAFAYTEKSMLFKELKSNPATITLSEPDDSVYQNFYTTVNSENIGTFEQVNDLIDSNNVASASALNNTINPNYIMEDNRKIVNTIYLQTVASNIYEFTPADSAALAIIANQDPLTNGEAVYSARVLLRIDPLENTERAIWIQNNEETPGQAEEKIVSKIYPNPNNGLMQLDYRLTEQQSGLLVIYDLTGRKINTYSLIIGSNTLQIDESEINSGIYFYQVIVNNQLIESDKIIIVK